MCVLDAGLKKAPKMLCLHGKASNSQISEQQIANLRLNLMFDVQYMNAPFEVENDQMRGMTGIHGPFYSWVSGDDACVDAQLALELVLEASADVDIIFGFSQGAAIALAAAEACWRNYGRRVQCLLVCPAGLPLLDELSFAGQGHVLNATNLAEKISVRSCFLIGQRDPWRQDSERMLSLMADEPLVLYMDADHSVPHAMQHKTQFLSNFMEWYQCKGMTQQSIAFPIALPEATHLAQPTSGALRAIHDVPVQWTNPIQAPPAGTLMDVLEKQPEGRLAICGESTQPATYALLAQFIRSKGHLGRFGICADDVVAYVVEEGPMSCVLFLTLAAQCAAAPLGCNSTSQEVSAALAQFAAKLCFASTQCQTVVRDAVQDAEHHLGFGVEVAVVCPDDEFQGSFAFANRPCESATLSPRMHAGATEVSLLLRTSGTTSKPKVVPLRMGSLVSNGSSIAQSLQLSSEDVCINAMPLFHIGALAASVLATLTSGGSVLCMQGFQPETFVEGLMGKRGAHPTWYSAVPTIHMALMQYVESLPGGVSSLNHTLRFIRSGAAALSPEVAIQMTQMWGCPVLPTYSMSEQMPISQSPPDYQLNRPGSVGVPLLTLVVVDAELNPLPVTQGEDPMVGEICISGPTVMTNYVGLDNCENFFFLQGQRYFRTGDLGYLDGDSFLHLAGRQKELIKVSGEQVSPHEVEDVLHLHEQVRTAVVFGFPDALRGEIVGAAVVLKDLKVSSPSAVVAELKALCTQQGLVRYKIPRIIIVEEHQLPRSASGKYLRNQMHKCECVMQSMSPGESTTKSTGVAIEQDAGSLSDATLGIRFILSVVVCLNHIGDHAWPYEEGHSTFSSTVTSIRTVGDLGVVCFGILAGLSLTTSMTKPIRWGMYLKFYESRLVPIHLIYLIACAFCIANRLAFCQPGDYQPYVWGSTAACQATPLNLPWGATWGLSLLVLALTLQAWPIGTLVWHISYYTWFSSAYQFCIFVYPWIQRALSDKAKRGTKVLFATYFMLHFAHFLTLVFMESVYLSYRDANPQFVNYFIWAGYMFPPFWALRFACGCMLGFHFMQARPDKRANAWIWGVITDAMTICMILAYVLLVHFGVEVEHRLSNKSLLESRMYCGVAPRLAVPFFSVYLYGLAVGRGVFARFCKSRLLVRVLSPASYSMYLLHQPVFEWYSVVTRGYWWTQRKQFSWFSPDPMEVNFWEAFIIITITTVFSIAVTYVTNLYLMGRWISFVRWITCRRRARHQDSAELVLAAIEELAGVSVAKEDRLQDSGLASLGVSALASMLNSMDSSAHLSVADLVKCETVQDVVDLLSTFREKRNGDKAPGPQGEDIV